MEQQNIYITKNQGTIWLKSDGNTITIETRIDIDLDGANRVGYKSIFNICSYFLLWNNKVLGYPPTALAV